MFRSNLPPFAPLDHWRTTGTATSHSLQRSETRPSMATGFAKIFCCMYIYMYLCMHVCMHIHIHMYICTYVNVYLCISIFFSFYVHSHVPLHAQGVIEHPGAPSPETLTSSACLGDEKRKQKECFKRPIAHDLIALHPTSPLTEASMIHHPTENRRLTPCTNVAESPPPPDRTYELVTSPETEPSKTLYTTLCP